MNQLRIRILEKYIEEDPSDPFNYYALSQEYQSENIGKATELFIGLLKDFPSYLPTYYSAGIFFAQNQQETKAKEILLAGIELAKFQNDAKTLRELQSALLQIES